MGQQQQFELHKAKPEKKFSCAREYRSSLLCSLAEGHASEGGGEGLGVHLAPGPLDVVVLPARVLGALKNSYYFHPRASNTTIALFAANFIQM